MPGRHRQNIFTKAVFPLDFGRTGSIAVQGSGYPLSGPRPDKRLAIRGAWSGANAAMSAVFRTTEIHPMKKSANSVTTKAKATKKSKVVASGKKSTRGKSDKSPTNVANRRPSPRVKTTKIEQCLTLLSNPGGATINELQAATGWQAHTVRGFLAGTVKKKLGLILDSEKAEDDVRRCREAADRRSRQDDGGEIRSGETESDLPEASSAAAASLEWRDP